MMLKSCMSVTPRKLQMPGFERQFFEPFQCVQLSHLLLISLILTFSLDLCLRFIHLPFGPQVGLFYTLAVSLKEFFERVNFNKE